MDQLLERFRILFHILCQASAFSLIVYWIYLYTLNKDLCTIDYKTFHHETENSYPILSLCFTDRSSDKLFTFDNHLINQSTYIEFLEGKYFDSSLLNINYDNVSIDMSDYIIGQWEKYDNGTKLSRDILSLGPKELFKKSKAWFYGSSFYNCYPLKIPQNKGLLYYGITMKNSIFQNESWPSTNGFTTLIHYPNQIMTSKSTQKWAWPERKANDTVIMRFKVTGVEILRRRKNGLQTCNQNWRNYDDDILVRHLNKVGCRAPYQNPSIYFPICKSKETMNRANIGLFQNESESDPPCKSMEKLYYTFEETHSPYIKKGHTEIGIYFYDQHFKEILRTRAIDINALIGTIGGYIGLFLGYSILQIPDFVFQVITRYSNNKTKIQKNKEIKISPTKVIIQSKFATEDITLKPDISNEEVVNIIQSFIRGQNKLLERLVQAK